MEEKEIQTIMNEEKIEEMNEKSVVIENVSDEN